MKNTTKWMVIAAALMVTAVAVVGIVGQADDSYADPVYEARIGETSYETLAEAVAAATDDQTVVLLVDVETSLSVPNTAQISLDFNGKTLTGSVSNSGTLTLTDSSATAGGIANSTAVNAITNTGTLTIEKISVSKTAESQYLIYNSGALTITSGMFNHTIADGKTGSMIRGADSGNNTITIDGGTFIYGGNNAMLMTGDYSTMVINDGTFTVNNDAPNLLCNWNVMTVNGGAFIYNADTGGQICFANDIAGRTSTLTINGGTFSSSGLNLYSGHFANDAGRVKDGAYLVFGNTFSMASFTYDAQWYEISENRFSRLAAAGTEGTGTACISDGAVTPTYTVTIRPLVDSNGSVDVGTVANVPAGSKITVNDNKITINGTIVTATPADPTPAKMHEFAQWAVGEVPLADQTPVNGDMTILAEFTDDLRKYTITFRNYDESLVWSYEPYYGETIMFGGENPTKPDDVPHTYQFTGWNTDKTATSGQDLGKVYGDTTFYAIYLEFTYTVSIVDSSSHTRYYIQLEDALEWAYVYGSDITLIGNPTVTHETTITHPTTIDGQGQYWITIDGVEVNIDTDFTVRNLADLKFDNDGRLLIKVSFDGNYTDAPEPAVLYSSFTLDGTTGDPDGHYVLPESPTRSGYTFKGWFTQATGGTQVTSQTVLAKTSAHTLYAHWDQVYTVTYSITNGQDIQQGSAVSGVDFASQPIVPNEHYALPTTDDITVTVGGAATQNYQYDIYGVIAIDSTYVTGDIVITAVCPIEKYAITLAVSEEGYGTVDPTSIANQAYGTTYSVEGVVLTIGTTPITAARATDTSQYTYAFDGWYIGESKIGEAGTITGATTFTAKFTRTERTYTVDLSTGEGYTLAAKAGSSSPVAYGGSYTFTFALDEAYSKSSAVVKVNDVTVTLVGGEYTITDIEEDQTVTVTGVTINKYTVIFSATPGGYGTVTKSTISGIPHGSTVAISGNTLTLNGTTVTATPAASTEEYTYAFSSWSVPDGHAITYTNQTITATFVQNVIPKHSVTYDLDGGSGEAPTQADVAEGATFTVAAYSGTKAGFTFGGWNDGSATYQSGADYTMGTADVTLTAVWNAIPKHSVTYDLDGGSGEAPTQADVAEGATFTVAAYSGTKAGFTFGGWNDGTTAYQPGSEYTMGTEDVTLTAVWDAIPTHHVTYVLEGGSGEAPTQADVAEGATFTVAAYSGTKAGHTFGGWNDGSKAYAAGDPYTMGTADVTLTAVWNAESYAVTIVGEGVTVYNGDVVVKNGDLVAYGSHLTTSLAPRTGYNGAVEPETADVTGPVTFTVSYVPITYSIAFDANGGEGTMANIGATYDAEAVLTANAFTRADYAFGGWAMAADGKAVYSDKAAVTNLTSTASATVTLYATWLQVEKKDGTAEITVTTNGVSDQAAQAVIDAAKEIAAAGTSATAEFNASETDDVSVKSDYVKEAADNNIAVTIGTKSGSLELPSEALKNLNVGSDAVIKTEIKNVERPSGYDLDKNAVVFSVLLTNNDVAYTTQFGTSFTVKLAFTPAAGVDVSKLKVMYLAGDGTLEEMSGCTYENGFMSFSTSHLSSYAIVDGSSSGGAGGSGSDSDWGLIAFVLIITALLIVVISMPVIAEKRGRQ